LLRELFAAGTPPSARAHHSATLLGEAVYVLGGATGGERPLRDAHVLDVSSMSWSQPEVRSPVARARVRVRVGVGVGVRVRVRVRVGVRVRVRV